MNSKYTNRSLLLSTWQLTMGKKKKKNSSARKPAASPRKATPPITEPEAAAGEIDHASESVPDRMYQPLPAKMIWMLPHSSRCHFLAVDHQRCSWACESGTLRRIFLYDTQQSFQPKMDWYKQHGLQHIGLRSAEEFNEPVNKLPASLTQITFGEDFNQAIEQFPASPHRSHLVSSSISQWRTCRHLSHRSHLVTSSTIQLRTCQHLSHRSHSV